MSPRVCGLDVSLTATGLAVPSGQTFTIKTGDAKLGDRRLVILRKAVAYYLDAARPTLAMVEMAARFRSQDAAIAVGMAQGIVREELAERDIPALLVNPVIVKQYATGHGNAEKRAMIVAANQARFAAEETEMITDANQAAAWWLRAMGLHHLGHRVVGHLGQVDIDLHDVRDRLVKHDMRRTLGTARRKAR